MRRTANPLVIGLLLLTTPAAARADVGTPLMWMGTFHLLILNGLIGLLEAFVLARLYKLERQRTKRWLIPANYFSMAVGWILLSYTWAPVERLLPGHVPLFKAPMEIGILLVASWVLSVLLEWPFCAMAIRATRPGWQSSLAASIVAQAASYAVIVPLYLLVSPISLFREVTIRPNTRFAAPASATVFYVDPADRGVWRARLDGTARRKVPGVRVVAPDARLFVRQDESTGRFDLWQAWRAANDNGDVKTAPVQPNIGHQDGDVVRGEPERDTWFTIGRPTDLRPPSQWKQDVYVGFWASEGLHVWNGEGDHYTLAFETPFESWICRNATVLPGSDIVFQLGQGAESQIVVLDRHTRMLGFLAMGHGPAVVLHAK